MDLSSKVALVVDNGLFVSFAQRLSREFGRVLYWTPWWSAFPKSNDRLIGTGLDGVERVNELFEVVDRADIVIFPDVYMGDLQIWLEEKGKRVWGGRHGEELELDRWGLKRFLAKVGLPVPPAKRIIGTAGLRSYLKEHEDVWVKVSLVRGDFETRQSTSYRLIEPWLDHLEHKLGAKKFVEEFIVEDTIEPAVELGYDGYTVDGNWPETAIYGYEVKDTGYIGCVRPYDQLPEVVRDVNAKLSPALARYHYRGNFSTEIRYTPKKQPFLIDPCCRLGSPPSEVYQELFANWGEIMWAGAVGEMVQPKPVAKYGVEALIHSSWADKEWAPVYIEEEGRQWVKLRNHCRIADKDYVVPQSVGLPEIGAVVGIGDTLTEAVKACAEHATQLEGFDIDIKLNAIDEALIEIEKAAELGIEFSDDPLPTQREIHTLVTGDGE